MNKKLWLKLLSLGLAAIFCLGMLVGCVGKGNKEESSDSKDVVDSTADTKDTDAVTDNGAESDSDVSSDVVDSDSDADTDVESDLESDPNGGNESASDETDTEDETEVEVDVLEGIKYNGEVVKVLSWIPSNLKEYVPEFVAGANIVEQKTFERMEKTKKQLGIGVSWVEEPGNGVAMDGFVQKASTGIMVGDYDVICCYSQIAATLTVSGFSSNLLGFETMDFSQEWYPQNFVNDCNMFDKLYFCTGDISTNLVNMTSMVFFNHELMDEYKINEKIQQIYEEENIYALVREGKWTQEALITLSKGVWEDSDNSGTATSGDTVGFSTYYTLLCNFYYGAGYKTINVGDTGISLSEDYMDSGIVIDILDTVGTFLHESGDAYYCGSFDEAQKMFSEGRSLFSLAPASHAYVSHAKSDVEFGALPVPKGSVDQPTYYSLHSRPYSMYLVPNTSEQADIAASFIQCLGKWSYTTTRKAIIETTMKGRYAALGVEDAEMWDYIIDSQTFDMGRVFEAMFLHTNKRANTDLFPVRLAANSTDWASIVETYREALETQCGDVNGMLQAFGN